MRDTIHFLFRDHRRCGTEQRSLLQLNSYTLNLIKMSWKCAALVKKKRKRVDQVWSCTAVGETCRTKVQYKSSTSEIQSASWILSPSWLMHQEIVWNKTVYCTPTVMTRLCLSSYTISLQLSLSGMANSCEEKDRHRGDIDVRPEEFDSRLWNCLKQGPAARTQAVFVHCGVKPVSMNLTAV